MIDSLKMLDKKEASLKITFMCSFRIYTEILKNIYRLMSFKGKQKNLPFIKSGPVFFPVVHASDVPCIFIFLLASYYVNHNSRCKECTLSS